MRPEMKLLAAEEGAFCFFSIKRKVSEWGALIRRGNVRLIGQLR